MGGSVLLLDEENSSKQSNGNVVLDMDELGQRNVQKQIALIDEQVLSLVITCSSRQRLPYIFLCRTRISEAAPKLCRILKVRL